MSPISEEFYEQSEPMRFRGPFRGINLAKKPTLLDPREAYSCLNVCLKRGTILKRPGWDVKVSADAHTGNPILGVYDYLKNTGTGLDVIHLFKAGVKLYKEVGGTVTELGTDAFSSATALPSFLTVNNRVYLADGATFKVTDAGTDPPYTAQIARPASLPAFGTPGVGVLTGTYDYKFTYYSSTWGQESPASDVTGPQTVTNNQIVIGTASGYIPDSTDARVDKVRIYRRKVSAGESVWSFVAEIADQANNTYTDNIRDENIDYLTISPLSYADTLPNFKYLAYANGVTFAAGSVANPTRLYYTPPNRPWVMEQWIDVGAGHDTEPITGLTAYGTHLVIWKSNSIWLLSGNSKDTFWPRRAVSGVGCRSHHSVVEADGLLAFLAGDGFRVFDGAETRLISGDIPDPVGPQVLARNQARDEFCVGVYDADLKAILWSYSAGATNNALLVYWIENSKAAEFPSWTPWLLSEDVNCWATVTDYSTKRRHTWIGMANGAIGAWNDDGEGDNTGLEPVDFYWITGQFDAGLPQYLKTWGELTVDTVVENVSSSMQVRYYRDDYSGTPVSLVTHALTDAVIRRRLGRTSRTLALQFYASNNTPVEVLSWTLEVAKAGLA